MTIMVVVTAIMMMMMMMIAAVPWPSGKSTAFHQEGPVRLMADKVALSLFFTEYGLLRPSLSASFHQYAIIIFHSSMIDAICS
jgi:hypothetical protein